MTLWLRQAAAIPVWDGKVCMVTSRSGRRWVLPKGQIDPGHTAAEAALIEAWEEAGLVGALDPDPVGSYVYEKYDAGHHVLVYRMTVTEVRDDWPERATRQRAFLSVAEVLDRVEEAGLRDLLRRSFRVTHPDQVAVA
jgi:8-oxo-dGTP pyrophosphatase MutT (NUDIX family)